MANLPEEISWPPDIYQLEESDRAKAGSGAVMNVQATQLANRTRYLKYQFDTHIISNFEEQFLISQDERTETFNTQLLNQLSAFISQFNQQAQEFDAQLTSQESRYEIVLQQAGKTVLGRYEDGPWTLTSYNQLVSYGGTFWKLAASVVIGAAIQQLARLAQPGMLLTGLTL